MIENFVIDTINELIPLEDLQDHPNEAFQVSIQGL